MTGGSGPGPGSGAAAGTALLVLLLAGTALARQASQEQTPVFPRDVEMVTVDVVVTDKKGEPVTDLSHGDFVVLDEGERRTLLSFDVVAPEAPPPAEAAAAAAPATPRPRVVTNFDEEEEDEEEEEAPGRTFVVFFDNLNMSPLNAQRAKAAVTAFLEKGLGDGDTVMLAASGGGAWWTTRMPEGYRDLVEVLKGLDGRRFYDAPLERLTDFEAMRIYVYSDARVAGMVQDRLERYGVRHRTENPAEREIRSIYVPGVVDPYVESRAAETYLALRTRNKTTLGALRRVLEPLGETRDRKSVILVSEGFIYDPSEEGFKEVVEASRRANAAIYFVDTRGLVDMPSFYTAQFGQPIDERNLLNAIADTTQEGEGSASLARDTGGFVVSHTNDLEDGIVRIGRESRSYYLLGFSPAEIPRDGRFRRLEVKVRRPGVEVRARRGYYAPVDAAAPPREPGDVDPQIQAALDSPAFRDAIPLRATTYVLDSIGADRARVMIAADVDISRVEFQEVDGRLSGSLDTLVVVARRNNSEFFRRDQKVDLERRAGPVDGPSWYTIVREFDLPGGTAYQARLVVRDAASRRVGTVTLSFDVPALDQLRVSTPILTDSVQQVAGGATLAVLLARRTFRSDRPLYCRFDVFGAKREERTGSPYVTSGHLVRRRDGLVLSRGEPSEIVPTSLGGLSRLMQIPLARAEPGDYELVLTVQDRHTGFETRVVEPFTIAQAAAP